MRSAITATAELPVIIISIISALLFYPTLCPQKTTAKTTMWWLDLTIFWRHWAGKNLSINNFSEVEWSMLYSPILRDKRRILVSLRVEVYRDISCSSFSSRRSAFVASYYSSIVTCPNNRQIYSLLPPHRWRPPVFFRAELKELLCQFRLCFWTRFDMALNLVLETKLTEIARLCGQSDL